MTNLEWLLSLNVKDIEKRYYREECTLCIYDGSGECDKRSCIEGKLRWLSKEHFPELKPCPVCKGKMSIESNHGCYLVCPDCGLHFGIDAEAAEQGIIEGGYSTREALVDAWNLILDTKFVKTE